MYTYMYIYIYVYMYMHINKTIRHLKFCYIFLYIRFLQIFYGLNRNITKF